MGGSVGPEPGTLSERSPTIGALDYMGPNATVTLIPAASPRTQVCRARARFDSRTARSLLISRAGSAPPGPFVRCRRS